MSEAPEGFSTSLYRRKIKKLSEDEFGELRKQLPSVRLQEQASLIKQQEARIKELEEQVTWQPIEAAPKDGTVVFVWHEARINPFDGFDTKIKKAQWLVDLGEWSVAGVGGNMIPTLTHWMPLPKPPKENEA